MSVQHGLQSCIVSRAFGLQRKFKYQNTSNKALTELYKNITKTKAYELQCKRNQPKNLVKVHPTCCGMVLMRIFSGTEDKISVSIFFAARSHLVTYMQSPKPSNSEKPYIGFFPQIYSITLKYVLKKP